MFETTFIIINATQAVPISKKKHSTIAFIVEATGGRGRGMFHI